MNNKDIELTIYRDDFNLNAGHSKTGYSSFANILTGMELIIWDTDSRGFVFTEKGKRTFPECEDWWEIDDITIRGELNVRLNRIQLKVHDYLTVWGREKLTGKPPKSMDS